MNDSTMHDPGLEGMKAALEGKRGKAYWRTLDELSGTEEFQKFLDDEFPNRSTLLQIDRRSLLKFMGASLALSGLTGCRSVFLPEDKVVPYVRQPEELVPGTPLYYASTVCLGGYGTGVLVEQHEGRPTKLEGNPAHPCLPRLHRRLQSGVRPLALRSRSRRLTHRSTATSRHGLPSSARSAAPSRPPATAPAFAS